MSGSSAETDAPEPIILVFSDKQVTLSPDLTARIWQEARLGYAKDPREFIYRALESCIAAHDSENFTASEHNLKR